MPKFNRNIKAWLVNEAGEKIIRYAFKHEKTTEKAIEGLYRRIILKYQFDYPIAKVYIDNKLYKNYIEGIEVDNLNTKWYGPEISEYKIKIVYSDGTKSNPFYSNSLVSKKHQLEMLVNKHCKSELFFMAIIMDKDDKLFATILKNDNEIEKITVKRFAK
jgi:hypothetical protein